MPAPSSQGNAVNEENKVFSSEERKTICILKHRVQGENASI